MGPSIVPITFLAVSVGVWLFVTQPWREREKPIVEADIPKPSPGPAPQVTVTHRSEAQSRSAA